MLRLLSVGDGEQLTVRDLRPRRCWSVMVVDVQQTSAGYPWCALCMIRSSRDSMDLARSGRPAVWYRSDEFGKQEGLSITDCSRFHCPQIQVERTMLGMWRMFFSWKAQARSESYRMIGIESDWQDGWSDARSGIVHYRPEETSGSIAGVSEATDMFYTSAGIKLPLLYSRTRPQRTPVIKVKTFVTANIQDSGYLVQWKSNLSLQ